MILSQSIMYFFTISGQKTLLKCFFNNISVSIGVIVLLDILILSYIYDISTLSYTSRSLPIVSTSIIYMYI